MIVQTITFENHEGETQTADFYFNLNREELTQFSLENQDGLEGILKEVGQAENMLEAYNIFKKIVLRSYGVRNADGVSFDKMDEDGRPLSRRFEAHPACGELIVDLLEHPDKAQTFMEGLFPAKHRAAIREATQKAERERNAGVTTLPVAPQETDDKPENRSLKAFDDYTHEELLELSKEDFEALLPKSPGSMTQPMLQAAMHRRGLGK